MVKMGGRSGDSVFMGHEVFSVDGGWRIGLWDFMQMFFPEKTNKKQFDCAVKFMKTLLEVKVVESTKLRELVGQDYVNLTMIVLPKLERFGLVKMSGERGRGKSYTISLDKAFSDRIRHVSMEWFRICAKYGDIYAT